MDSAAGNISIHALSGGSLTLPERFFVTPPDDVTARRTVPSLAFLIQHRATDTGKVTRVLFDLGIRRNIEDYEKPIIRHALTRQPVSGSPDVVASLKAGGLTPQDIDLVIFSHLHWDHIGAPSDFDCCNYVIGPGAAKLIDGTATTSIGTHNHFEQGILDMNRTIELPLTASLGETEILRGVPRKWHQKGPFDAAIDWFGDGSMFVVSAPGHLNGHINLLCRQKDHWVYLAGDACHDERLLTGTKGVATWVDPQYPGSICCIHKDKKQAEDTIKKIRQAASGLTDIGKVEVIFAHDVRWENSARGRESFFPRSL